MTRESDIQRIFDEAEKGYEYRRKVQEASNELRRLMSIRAEGKSLMKVNGKWKEAFYPKRGGK